MKKAAHKKNKISIINSNSDLLLCAVIAIIILLPKLNLIKVLGTTTSIRTEDFLLAFLYAIWILQLLFKKIKLKLTIVHKLMIVFIGIGTLTTILGILNNSVPFPHLGLLNIFRRIEYFGMFFVAFSWIRRERLQLYITGLLATSLGVLGVGILQYFNIIPMFPSWAYAGQIIYFKQLPFLISTFGGHYDLGAFIIILTPLAIISLINQKSIKLKALHALLLLGYYFLLTNSFSRAAYGGFLICMIAFFVIIRKYIFILFPFIDSLRVVWLYFNGKFSRYEYTLKFTQATPTPTPITPSPSPIETFTNTATSSSSISEITHKIENPIKSLLGKVTHSTISQTTPSPVPTPAAVQQTPTPVFNITSDNTVSLPSGAEVTLDPGGAIRIPIWKAVLNHFFQNPLLGTGYSSIGNGADNQYIRLLGEVGLLGFFSFFSIIGAVLYILFKTMTHKILNLENLFFHALFASIIGLLVQAVLIDIFDSSKIAFLLWFLIGIGMKIAFEQKESAV